MFPLRSVKTSTGCARNRRALDHRMNLFPVVVAAAAIVAVDSGSCRQLQRRPRRSLKRCFGSSCDNFARTCLRAEGEPQWGVNLYCSRGEAVRGHLLHNPHRHQIVPSRSPDRRANSRFGAAVAAAVGRTDFPSTQRDLTARLILHRHYQRMKGCLSLKHSG